MFVEILIPIPAVKMINTLIKIACSSPKFAVLFILSTQEIFPADRFNLTKDMGY